MRMIRPKIEAPTITIAEEQEEFLPVTAAIVANPNFPTQRALAAGDNAVSMNTIVMAFEPSAEERARLTAGEPIYVHLLTFMRPMQPIIVSVGAEETAAMYGLEVEK